MTVKLTENEYRTLVEQAPILIWRANKEKLCDYFNTTWLNFTGRTMDQEYGNGWAEGVHPDDFDRCLEIYVTNFDQKKIFEMRYRVKRYDGVYRWLFDRGVPFYNENKEFMGYIGSCIDITDQVNAELAVQKMNDEKIKKLETLLPLCAWCKKVHTENNDWLELETYIIKNNKQNITHSVCPGCKDKLLKT